MSEIGNGRERNPTSGYVIVDCRKSFLFLLFEEVQCFLPNTFYVSICQKDNNCAKLAGTAYYLTIKFIRQASSKRSARNVNVARFVLDNEIFSALSEKSQKVLP